MNICLIPARVGSKRVKKKKYIKTLSLELNPLDFYGIDTMQDFKIAEKLYKLKFK